MNEANNYTYLIKKNEKKTPFLIFEYKRELYDIKIYNLFLEYPRKSFVFLKSLKIFKFSANICLKKEQKRDT